jgi:regulator of protease activity HflC (stomatin/prohibitin superfamily)
MRALNIVAAILLVLFLLPPLASTYVGPDEIGVRQSLLSGISERDYGQGRILTVPFIHTVHVLPSTLQYLSFVGPRALSLRTKENNTFDLDVTIIYRIKEGEAHLIVSQGFKDTLYDRVLSVSQGFLRDHLSQLSIEEFQIPEKREEATATAIEPLNLALAKYHVEVPDAGVLIRAVRFRPDYEARLQSKQQLAVERLLDTAKEKESEARQATTDVEKDIEKAVKIETENWNGQIEELRAEFELAVAEVDAQTTRYDAERRAAADAICSRANAEGARALAVAEAYGERLRTEALSSRAGRTYSAIKAAENFKMGDIKLNSLDPNFLRDFGSMESWRRFFLSKSGR